MCRGPVQAPKREPAIVSESKWPSSLGAPQRSTRKAAIQAEGRAEQRPGSVNMYGLDKWTIVAGGARGDQIGRIQGRKEGETDSPLVPG